MSPTIKIFRLDIVITLIYFLIIIHKEYRDFIKKLLVTLIPYFIIFPCIF